MLAKQDYPPGANNTQTQSFSQAYSTRHEIPALDQASNPAITDSPVLHSGHVLPGRLTLLQTGPHGWVRLMKIFFSSLHSTFWHPEGSQQEGSFLLGFSISYNQGMWHLQQGLLPSSCVGKAAAGATVCIVGEAADHGKLPTWRERSHSWHWDLFVMIFDF